jgi:hypothetical protein
VNRKLYVLAALVVAIAGFFVGTALASNAADIVVVFEDDFIVVYQDNDFGARIVANKVGGVDTYCPCEEEVCPLDSLVEPTATSQPPTATSQPPTATSQPPTATSQPPTATSQPPYNGVWIHHESQGVGDPSWTRCMPESAWNGHRHHEGDWLGGGCYR